MVEFQFFKDCPNSQKTLENLMHLVHERALKKSEVKITEIVRPEEAELRNFQGSPTILVNGIDIYTGVVPTSSRFSCRTYVIDGKRTGTLGSDFIKERLAEFHSGHGE